MSMKKIQFLTTVLFLLLAGSVMGQMQMVKDLRTAAVTMGSNPSQFCISGNLAYFVATDPIHCRELWRSDGTEAGTFLLKDFLNTCRDEDPEPNWLTDMNGTLYFSAATPGAGREIWKSDGTPAGTVMLKDIIPGTNGSNPGSFTYYNGYVYFSAYTPLFGHEIWRTDGTEAGTTMVADIQPGQESSDPYLFEVCNGTLFFTANNGINGYELWQSNGTAAGTVMVKDFNPGGGGISIKDMAVMNGILYFSANAGSGDELYRSDGTAPGTFLLKEMNPGGQDGIYYEPIFVWNNSLYFVGNNSVNGWEVWKSDGSTVGTVLLMDINPGSGNSVTRPGFIVMNNELYFSADDGVNGVELWKSDGTPTGTSMLKDIHPNGNSNVYGLTLINQALFFYADDGTHGGELWRTDGTNTGTYLVKDIHPGSTSCYSYWYYVLNGQLIFSAHDGVHGQEPWISDGTETGTGLIKDIYAGNEGGMPFGMMAIGNSLLFSAADDTHGLELWKSDGTDAGTVLVKDINPGTNGCFPDNHYGANNLLLFTADDGTSGLELWKSDGTVAGTHIVKDINPGANGSSPYGFRYSNGIYYFINWTSANGTELWRTDGTDAGTYIVKDIASGNNSSYPAYLTDFNGILVFQAGSDSERELWRSDGTEAGTYLIKDILPGGGGSSPYGFTVVGNYLYFRANDDIHGDELWRTDGTSTGTVMVMDINPLGSGYPDGLFAAGNLLYFIADDGTHGYELWKTDGATTVLVKDILPGNESSVPLHFQFLNGILYFTADDLVHGRELWKTNGTEAGTVMIKDLYSGVVGSNLSDLLTCNNSLYFFANDGIHGKELWKSDGTEAGSLLVAEAVTGSGDGTPNGMVLMNNTLFFSARDEAHGFELWKYTPEAPATPGTVLQVMCQGSSFDIPVLVGVGGYFNPGNIFTAQLSDSSGSFLNPTDIGSLVSSLPGILSASIPLSQAPGSGYRIRLISSDPPMIGPDNGIDLLISALPQADIIPDGATTFCQGGFVTLMAALANAYEWSNSHTSQSIVVTTSGTYTVTVTNAEGCSAISSPIVITVHTTPTLECPIDVVTPGETGQCGAVVNFDNPLVTGDPLPLVSYSIPSGSLFPVDLTTVVATASNICGTVTCDFTILVEDEEAPEIVCPSNIYVLCASDVPLPDVGSVSATDNCMAGLMVSFVNDQLINQICTNKFEILRTYRAMDLAGKSDVCTQTIQVEDIVPPVINQIASNLMPPYNQSVITAWLNNHGGAVASDACGAVTWTNDFSGNFNLNCNALPVVVTFTATDECGNLSVTTASIIPVQSFSVSIAPLPVFTLYPTCAFGSGNAHIVKGFTNTVQFNATPSGGSPGYTYSWYPTTGLNNALISNPVFNPTMAQGSCMVFYFTLTVTDANGCTAVQEVHVNAMNPQTPGTNNKYTICHNIKNYHNINVSVNSLPAHFSNNSGNCLGSCTQITGNCPNNMPVKLDNVIHTETGIHIRNYPNPFNGVTIMEFSVPEDGLVQLAVFDLTGKLVHTVFNSEVLSGYEYNVEFDGSSLSPGIYLYRMISSNEIITGKMILSKD